MERSGPSLRRLRGYGLHGVNPQKHPPGGNLRQRYPTQYTRDYRDRKEASPGSYQPGGGKGGSPRRSGYRKIGRLSGLELGVGGRAADVGGGDLNPQLALLVSTH